MSTTPLLQQYFAIREQHPDTLLLFQVGDFYEIFFDDAKKASAYLGITLTKRGTHNGEPVPLCGVPVHTLDHYLVKLVRGGFRIAVCDQLEAARPGKVVDRGVTQVLTPGTLTDIKLLDEKSASYCAAIFPTKNAYGCLFVELLTGHLFVTIIPSDNPTLFEAELRRFSPDEIVFPNSTLGIATERLAQRCGYVTTLFDFTAHNETFDDWFTACTTVSREIINRSDAAQAALKLLHGYLKKNQEQALAQCSHIFFYSPDDFLMLDAATQRNLELVKNLQDGSAANTLFSVLDQAITSMGSRMIKKWLVRPLIKSESIEQRLNVVELFVKRLTVQEELAGYLKDIGDIERVVGRIALQRAHLYDYIALMRALGTVPAIKLLLADYNNVALLQRMVSGMGDFAELCELLQSALNDDALHDYKIKPGYHSELDRMRGLMNDGARAIVELERAEQARTGIQSLKIRYNKINGYTIEVTKANINSVPDDYQRLQTLVNRERYTMPALKDLEYDISRAKNESVILEQELYEQIKENVAGYVASLKKMAQSLAQCDALLGFARAAYKNNYVRPELRQDRDLLIANGRHPVVASKLEHNFIPNDTSLTDQETTWIITGPNMGGKSTYLRQVALMSVMAQVGSFVSAERAQVPLLDRIFTRIGAGDNVAEGKSTFLVEMEETALICNQATEKSLVILDEVGRGTSTYDGLAIAQAVVEYLHNKIGGRALFATHYHELTALCGQYDGIVVYYAASKQTDNGIILLHKIVKGIADGSFGIEVAKGVQLPAEIVTRAQIILGYLKEKEQLSAVSLDDAQAVMARQQNKLYAARITELEQELVGKSAVTQKLKTIDYNNLSPKQAFDLLWELKN